MLNLSRYLGDFIAAVCHRPNNFPNMPGHYVCYSRTDDDVWYCNSDDKRVDPSRNPFQSQIRGETISMLIYKNF